MLINLVYLTHCEGAILLGWWWEENDHSTVPTPVIHSSSNDVSITTTQAMGHVISGIDANKDDSMVKTELKIKIKRITSKKDTLAKTIKKFKGNVSLNVGFKTNRDDQINEYLVEENLNIPLQRQVSIFDSSAASRNVTLLINRETSSQEVTSVENFQVNDRPIIGVLSQEQSSYLHSKYPEENFTSYIAASYVKFVEASGARVVPILIGKDRAYYKELSRKINGVLLPGGATFFNQSHGFADAGQYIYEEARDINDNGGYFPIFGICLGFELLIILASGRGEKENRMSCCSYSNCSLKFVEDFRNGRMFRNTPEEIVDMLTEEEITVNAHQFCITNDNLKSYNLINDWHVTSYSVDDKGVNFVATVENKRYPFYGVQFHPEKPSFEWKLSKNYPHTDNAIQANRYFMDFFIKEAKKNHHHFQDVEEENKYLIYNYEPYFTGLVGSAYHQCYFF